MFGKIPGDQRDVLVGCAVHCGLAIFIDSVDVAAILQSDFHCFENFRLGPRIFSGRIGPDARSDHQRRCAVVVGKARIGAEYGVAHVRGFALRIGFGV